MRRAVICFTRVPRPGRTKTRLLPVLSGEQCALLHTAFLRDLAAVYRRVEADLFVAYAPDPGWEVLQAVFPDARDLFPQEGEGLGQRMEAALERVLALGYEACVLTGADLPRMTGKHLESGFAALEEADVAVGPTSDGGYYLIGMKRPCPEVFAVEGYGGGSALARTLAAARAAGRSAALGDPCDDVDTPEDLLQLAGAVSPNSHTGQVIALFREEGLL